MIHIEVSIEFTLRNNESVFNLLLNSAEKGLLLDKNRRLKRFLVLTMPFVFGYIQAPWMMHKKRQ